MQKLWQKHQKFMKGNAGFSLVELIIVIAIMAALVAILAPQYLKYVEKSRVSADKATLDSIMTNVQVALADPDCSWKAGDVTSSVDASTGKVTLTFTAVDGTGATKVSTLFTAAAGNNDIVLKSKVGKALGTGLKITVADSGSCSWGGYPTEAVWNA